MLLFVESVPIIIFKGFVSLKYILQAFFFHSSAFPNKIIIKTKENIKNNRKCKQ